MVITCEQCQARFRLADEKLKPEGTKVRCTKCKLVFTVFPQETLPAGLPADTTGFNREPGAGEEVAPLPVQVQVQAPAPVSVAATEPSTPPEPPPAAAEDSPADSNEMDLDFSGLEQSMGPGTAGNEPAEEFSFADTVVAAVEPSAEEGLAAEPADRTISAGIPTGSEPGPGELDFDATFAESEEPPAVIAPAAGPAEFAFDAELAQGGVETSTEGAAFDFAAAPEFSGPGEFDFAAEPQASTPGEVDFAATAETAISGEFDFATESQAAEPGEIGMASEPATPASGDFVFASEEAASGLSEFGFETEADGEPPAAVDETLPAAEAPSFEFGSGDSFESSALSAEPAFGEAEPSWDQPANQEGLSFDFDEPNFESQNQERVAKGRDEAGLSFGEIDFSDDDTDKTPSFGSEPDFSQAAMAPAPAPEPLPVPTPPPPPRPEARRLHSGEAPPPPLRPRKKSMSPALGIIALLLILCGAGGYYYFMGNGRPFIDRMLLKVKGEVPPAPVEQLIVLSIEGSSYVKNREAGQLLVVQGAATNNFPTARTAISVKGVLLDAAGKVLQQQTLFCGNYLDETKLRTMKYAQIEEAMNNQFGDSLSNINVSPGKTLRFTIVFRNVPKEMANINVEVVDSKPGG